MAAAIGETRSNCRKIIVNEAFEKVCFPEKVAESGECDVGPKENGCQSHLGTNTPR
ncbi:hypothetical protein KP79_PYT18077 [Mizuhopecten yessoensis]|uniref:Uncharacterized protein n=1 Tax=Mizuhopecten yessoensis TaxID=6573 RepID=A0A210PV99_MIZYE|nr:hypothetical protein KP79_PYT18077 [Mizuhopecten yessoensis]